MRLIFNFMLIGILFFCQEALVSQVAFTNAGQRSKEDIESLIKNSELIVLVEPAKEQVVLRKVVFPKDTHLKKTQETVYSEVAEVYLVKKSIEVKKNDQKIGAKINVYLENAYGENEIKAYHEQGISESPIFPQLTPFFEIKGKERVLFLVFDKEKKVYSRLKDIGAVEEGPEALGFVEKYLNLKK